MNISYNVPINISIILPFGNDSAYIEQCLDSLISQNYPNMEILCIGCQSTDDTAQIVARYAKSYPFIRQLKTSRIYNINQAYNIGMAAAEGKYIKFINARMIFYKFAMQILYNQMKYEQTDLVIHSLSTLCSHQTYKIDAQWDWLKNYSSPALIYDILPFCNKITDIINATAFSHQFASDCQLHFDERLSELDEVPFFKLLLSSERVSLMYQDLGKQTCPLLPTFKQSEECLHEICLHIENTRKFLITQTLVALNKIWLIEYILSLLARYYKLTPQICKKEFLLFARDQLETLCTDSTDITDLSEEAKYNYSYFMTGVDNIKLSIVYRCDLIDDNLKQFILRFLEIKNICTELVIYTSSDQQDIMLDNLCRISDFIKINYTPNTTKIDFSQLRGEYCLIQSIQNQCFDKTWSLFTYAHQNNADVLFAVKEYGAYIQVEGNQIYDEYLKYKLKNFTYLNIYSNRLFDLLYSYAQILYKTAYITQLNTDNIIQLPLLATLQSSSLMIYPKPIAAYIPHGLSESQCKSLSDLYHKITHINLAEISEYDKILCRFKVASQTDFAQKLTALQSKYSHKQLKYSAKTDNKSQDLINRAEVASSPLWDEKFYLTQFDFSPYDINVLPLDHYLQDGWKKGFSPSHYFNGPEYARQHNIKDVNPLVFYLQKGRFRYKGLPTNAYPYSESDIKNYWRHKKKNNKVVYMCITGDYDKLEEIKAHTYINPDWDYVCFTDNKQHLKQKTVGIWQIHKLQFTELDNTRNNRYHKVFPHILFPEYQESIYIDSNINILTPFIYDEIKQRNVDILLPKHAGNFSIYHEYNWALLSKVDKPELIMAACEEIMNTGFPSYYGMPECNIIYRQHSSQLVKKMMEEWWYWIKTYAKRDQLSFSYLLWKEHLTINSCTFVNARIAYQDFCVFLHPNDRITEQ